MKASLLALLLLTSCISSPGPPASRANHLFVWTRAAAAPDNDFLSVLDLNEGSPTYAQIVATLPVPGGPGYAHHTEHQMPAGGILFANAFGTRKTYLFDLTIPTQPRLAGSFEAAGEYMHPHSFARLANGNVLATYQMRGHDNERPGALVEISQAGRVIRASDAADPAVELFIRPYSLVVVPALDRVVTQAPICTRPRSADLYRSGASRTWHF